VLVRKEVRGGPGAAFFIEVVADCEVGLALNGMLRLYTADHEEKGRNR
jgi:hypothetical protein